MNEEETQKHKYRPSAAIEGRRAFYDSGPRRSPSDGEKSLRLLCFHIFDYWISWVDLFQVRAVKWTFLHVLGRWEIKEICFKSYLATLTIVGIHFLKLKERPWGDGSALRSICCSYRGPGFSSQGPNGSSQTFATLVPRGPIFSSDLCGHQARTWYAFIYADRTLTYIKPKIKWN